jgi:hypothetical protein
MFFYQQIGYIKQINTGVYFCLTYLQQISRTNYIILHFAPQPCVMAGVDVPKLPS